MKKNDSLPFWDAVKVYYGTSLVRIFICMFLLPVSAVLLFVTSIFLMSGGKEEALCVSSIGVILFFCSAYMFFIMDVRVNSSNLPGWKFLKTVKGGFDTYAKAAVTITAVSVLVVLLYSLIAALLYIADIVSLFNTPGACFALWISEMVLIAVIVFLRLIENTTVRLLAYSAVLFQVLLLYLLLLHTVKSMSAAVWIISAAASMLMIAVSSKVSISYYKKKIWEN